MQPYQYFSTIAYLLLFLFIYSLIPNFLMNKLPDFFSNIYFGNNKLQLFLGLVISLTIYVLTYRKPLLVKNKEEIIRKLEEEADKEGLPKPPYKFTWDGCSGGVSALANFFFQNVDWEDGEGCLTHDYRYWRGGTQSKRSAADNALYNYIVSKGHSKIYAFVIWAAVMFGGFPFIPAPWRWGYGFPYPQKIFY